MKIIQKKLNNSRTLSSLFCIFSRLASGSMKLNKYRNIVETAYSISHAKKIIENKPIKVRIAPITVCNYRCQFCEIHKDNLLFPNRSRNIFTLQHTKNYETFLSSAYCLAFYGGSEEPLLNPYFGEIVAYLKKKYNLRMFVNTNASVLTEKLSRQLVENGFDDILVSYHAGTKESYKQMMTGDLERVNQNLLFLHSLKQSMKSTKPVVSFNFALQKFNAPDYHYILENAKSLGVESIMVQRYHGGRNKLQDSKVSFEYDMVVGNKVLDRIYRFAEKIGMKVCPPKPKYWKKSASTSKWDTENYDSSKKCILPWSNLHFNPVLDDKDCHYVGVCNRRELFKLNYEKLKLDSEHEFNLLWNHPMLQYLRETVNSKNINPLCKYCKNHDREYIRNFDAKKYAEVRDKAVEDFFTEFNNRYKYEEIDGLEILKDNPLSDNKFLKKLEALDS